MNLIQYNLEIKEYLLRDIKTLFTYNEIKNHIGQRRNSNMMTEAELRLSCGNILCER